MSATKSPVVFVEFLELGLPETSSPFLRPDSRGWGQNLELRSSFLAALLLCFAFVLSLFGVSFASNIALLLVYFLVGVPSLIESIEDLCLLDVNIDVLMTLAAFSSIFIGGAMEGGLLLVLFAISGSLEEMVTNKAKGAIRALKEMAPKTALLVKADGSIKERAVVDIIPGDLILVRSGEVTPLDGVVKEGASLVNLVHLTGEAVPQKKEKGDTVPAGAVAVEGSFTLKVTHASFDSTLARIIHLVTEAEGAKPRLQRWFDQTSRWYAISIISLFVFFALSFPFWLSIPFLGVEGSLYRALAFLIAASPCALIIAIPTAYLSAISSCAKHGVMLKGGLSLDALLKCQNIAFDKTGTLTTGNLTLTHFEGGKQALAIANALERGSKHPIALAIQKEAALQQIPPLPIEKFQTVPGYGVKGVVNDTPCFIGNAEYLDEEVVRGEFLTAILEVGTERYLFQFEDQLRPNIRPLMERLKKNHTLVMLTGDHLENAKRVAQQTGIDHFYSDLKPEDKLRHVSQLADQGGLAMVGDGINDAPALARASVGIAMGKVGSGAALEASDIVLLQDNLASIEWLFNKAKKTRSVVTQNLMLATGAILLASFPALMGLVPLWLAVILHEGGTVLVGLNALRLLR